MEPLARRAITIWAVASAAWLIALLASSIQPFYPMERGSFRVWPNGVEYSLIYLPVERQVRIRLFAESTLTGTLAVLDLNGNELKSCSVAGPTILSFSPERRGGYVIALKSSSDRDEAYSLEVEVQPGLPHSSLERPVVSLAMSALLLVLFRLWSDRRSRYHGGGASI